MANYQSSNPITPLGGNGALPALPAATITPPQLANPADRTQELLARTQESVDRGFQAQASVLSSAAELGQAAAANRTQNGPAQVFSGMLSAIGAGFTLYGELDMQKKQREAELARARAEQASAEEQARAEALLAQQESVKAQIEIELTETAQDLLEEVGSSTFSQGNITTRRQLARSLITESGLSPVQQAGLFRFFNNEIDSVQTGLNTRLITQYEEVQDNTLQVQKTALLSDVGSLVVGLVAGNPASVNPESIGQQVNTTINRFFEQNPNIPYVDQLALVAEVYGAVNVAYEKYGIRTTEINVRQQLLGEAITEYQSIMAQTQGNTEARRLGIEALTARYASLGLSGINWGSIEYTDAQRAADNAARTTANRTLQDEALRNDPVLQEFQSAVALESAYQIFSNPGRLGAEIARLEDSEDTLDQATLYYVELLTSTRDELAEIHADEGQVRIQRQELYAEYQQILDQVDPTGRLGPMTMSQPDIQRVIQLADSALARNEISAETRDQLVNVVRTQLVELDNQETELARRANALSLGLDGTGISPLSLTDYDSNMPRIRQRAAAATSLVEQRQRENQLTQPPGPANFSAGPMLSTPPIVPLATNSDGVTFPTAATNLNGVRITSGYGPRQSPTSGASSEHRGIDLAIPGNIRTIGGGTVVQVRTGDNGGYGGTVIVRTPDGFLEQYSHLRSLHVEVGQIIAPGADIGIMGGGAGDPHAGTSTGRHLHFAVMKPGTTDEQTYNHDMYMDPMDYMTMRQHQVPSAPGVGRPANSPSPANNNPLSRGQQLWQSLFMTNPVTNTPVQARGNATAGGTGGGPGIQNNVTPYNQALASTRRNPYREGSVRNDGEANHGYQALRTDRNLRVAVHQTASALGIPSQWLADLIDYETAGTWDAGVTNGLGCVGLQFCPGGELDEVANEFGGNRDAARRHLIEIGLDGQLEYLKRYFLRYANGGRDLTTIGALYAGWNGGPSRIRNPNSLPSDGPAASRGAQEHGSPLNHHLMQFGRRVGRRYDLRSSTRGADIGHTHTTAVNGCPICNEQLGKGMFTPHIGDIA